MYISLRLTKRFRIKDNISNHNIINTFRCELKFNPNRTGGPPSIFVTRECFAPCEREPRTTPHTCVSMKKLRNLKPGIEICRRFGVIFMKIEIFLKIVFYLILIGFSMPKSYFYHLGSS